jgi:hypothetical protein
LRSDSTDLRILKPPVPCTLVDHHRIVTSNAESFQLAGGNSSLTGMIDCKLFTIIFNPVFETYSMTVVAFFDDCCGYSKWLLNFEVNPRS